MATPTDDVMIGMYATMVRIRAADDALQALLMSGQAMLMLYSPRGHEAIAAGVAAHLRRDDYLVATYRGLHDHIAKGVPLVELFAEFLGRAGGTCKGKGGGMHITHPESGLMVTTGIVGGGLPIANGLALAAQLRDEDRVVVCNFGDGASNIGAFHEALNLASLWKLPVLFVCQNNGYAEHTAFEHGTTVDSVADRASSYRMAGVTVDGRDPVAVHTAAGEAIDRARRGEGPTLLEARTARLGGHFVGDDAAYVPAQWLDEARAADPLPAFRARLVTNGRGEDELTKVEEDVRAEVQTALDAAMVSPFPDLGEIRIDVYRERMPA